MKSGLLQAEIYILNLRNQKIELSKIYVFFLLIPTPVSRMIKAFAGKIEQVLEIDKNFWLLYKILQLNKFTNIFI